MSLTVIRNRSMLLKLKAAWRSKIERSYQRAMNIRDSTPAGPNFEKIESRYLYYYLKAYKSGDGSSFTTVTRRYLKALRTDVQ